MRLNPLQHAEGEGEQSTERDPPVSYVRSPNVSKYAYLSPFQLQTMDRVCVPFLILNSYNHGKDYIKNRGQQTFHSSLEHLGIRPCWIGEVHVTQLQLSFNLPRKK
jgi:hypothetical protein